MDDDELKDAARGAFESAMAFGVDRHAFERLARSVRDAEREACAKVCEEYSLPDRIEGAHPDYLEGKRMAFHQAALAIRKRSNAR